MAQQARSLHGWRWWLMVALLVLLLLYLGSYLVLRVCHRFVHYAREQWVAAPGDGRLPERTIWHAVDDPDSYAYYLGNGHHGRSGPSRLIRYYLPLAWAETRLRAWADPAQAGCHAPFTPRPWARDGQQ